MLFGIIWHIFVFLGIICLGMILDILCYKGDLTEDPDHPKLFWPSDQNCPRCYNWKSKRSISVDVGLAVLIEGMLYLVDK